MTDEGFEWMVKVRCWEEERAIGARWEVYDGRPLLFLELEIHLIFLSIQFVEKFEREVESGAHNEFAISWMEGRDRRKEVVRR